MKTRLKFAIITVALILIGPSIAFAEANAVPEGGWGPLLLYIINFGLFIYLIKRFGGPQISGFFRERAKTIRENLGRSENAFKEAQALAKQAAEQNAGLSAERNRIAAEMAEETRYQLGQITELTRETIARIRRDRELSVAAAHEAGQRQLREALAEAAGRIAREIVRRDFQPSDQKRLLDSFAGKLQEEARH
jgi:F0F1-type ATP synthase membrane subunit b/b'